jgi:tetratricopeptide (TPR) repeat protein
MSSAAPISEPSVYEYPESLTLDRGVRALRRGDRYERWGGVEQAIRAYQIAADKGDPECAAIAAYRLGVLYLSREEDVAALGFFRNAAESRDPQAVGWAQYRVGTILEKQRDFAGAESAFRRADELGNPEGPTELSRYLQERDPTGAENTLERGYQRGSANAAYQLALAHSHVDKHGSMVWSDLGRRYLKQADERGHPDAPLYIGLDTQITTHDEAISCFKRAEARRNKYAAFELAVAYRYAGDNRQAKRAYKRVYAQGHPDTALEAALWLGHLNLYLGYVSYGSAADWYRRAAASNDPYIAAQGSIGLGRALLGIGNVAAAIPLLEQGYADGDPNAAFGLGLAAASLPDAEQRWQRRDSFFASQRSGDNMAVHALNGYAEECSRHSHRGWSRPWSPEGQRGRWECPECGSFCLATVSPARWVNDPWYEPMHIVQGRLRWGPTINRYGAAHFRYGPDAAKRQPTSPQSHHTLA